MSSLDDLVAYLHWHKPNLEEMLHTYRHHSYFNNWLTVIYLLLTERRYQEAQLGIDKISHVAYSLDATNPDWRISEGIFGMIDKLQKDFVLSCTYVYNEQQRRITSL